jgi:hypothetical protein
MITGIIGFLLGGAIVALVVRNNPDRSIAWLNRVKEDMEKIRKDLE